MPTKIEWAEETWNPIVGCTKCSPGCDHCYAERMAARLKGMGGSKYQGVITDGKWNGQVAFDPRFPFTGKKPKRIFVSSMGDLFHSKVSRSWMQDIVRIQSEHPQHIFFWLTKRAPLMRMMCDYVFGRNPYPENLWTGVTVCNQDEAERKTPELLRIPSVIRFLSIEPMLGSIDLSPWIKKLNWVIVGGESGPGARPMQPDWVRSVRDQCADAGVPFLFKQWGEYGPVNNKMVKMNKKHAGRALDGVIHDGYPK